ncbi:Uncharacterised protein [Mycobacteroides abscessus subsp. abscessus]|uniref:hypothetical protein n=1 Tax=Mycobacteroides abscessus TaxID=36809 RepID=UPI0009275B11|nr:hypothetical protein [Mycobacteroides abscessus]SIM06440.1 Uncharacterised protein [Mycobacteroides abscessus subsp. abscessus]SLC77143.1 Uncharacterised protein [Mycobacteroides abscessus subsp. abscessus]
MTGAISIPEAKRRADLLSTRYDELTAGNTGFDYQLLMDPTDPVAAALTGGREKVDDIAPLVSNDDVFHVWRLRLEHPQWWIGGRVRDTTPLLARIISELAGRRDDGPHLGGSGYTGAHWFSQSLRAIAPLSSRARDQLAVALRRELIGRNMCQYGIAFMSFVSDRTFDPAEMFPESEHVEPVDSCFLGNATYAVRTIHGEQWFEAFNELVSGLDPITWAGLTEALNVELRESGIERER